MVKSDSPKARRSREKKAMAGQLEFFLPFLCAPRYASYYSLSTAFSIQGAELG